MTLVRLGEDAAARDALTRARAVLAGQGDWAGEEALSLLREAEVALDERP
jgi:hypothetical protein